MKRSTLNDIAEKTGVSITTISRVLNGKTKEFRISAKTEQIVKNAVAELDYKPNIIAQNLRNNNSRIIGLLVPNIENPFFASIAGVIIREAAKYSYPVMVLDTQENPVNQKLAIDTLLSRNVDGIMVVPCDDNGDELQIINNEKPLVLIDRYFPESDIPYVSTDNYQGAYLATNKLIEAGHTHILCLQGVLSSITTTKRKEGYIQALRDAGIESNAMIRGNNFSIENGYVETQLALSSGNEFTAIFAMSSTNLLGALGALKDRNISVPEQVSLVSFDDNIFLNYMQPSISCISQPIESIGTAAVKMLLNIIESKGIDNINIQSIEIPPRFISRNSIALFH